MALVYVRRGEQADGCSCAIYFTTVCTSFEYIFCAFNNPKELENEARHELNYIYRRNRMKVLYPINENHWSIVVFTLDELISDELHEGIKLEGLVSITVGKEN